MRGRDRRRQVRRALEDEARTYWQRDAPLMFWTAAFELADGSILYLDGDALDRELTREAVRAFAHRRIDAAERDRVDDPRVDVDDQEGEP